MNHGLAVQAQQGGPGQIDLDDPPVLVPQEIRNRGEIEQVGVPRRRLLSRCFGGLEFFVLHLQFDPVHLQLVDQGASVRFGHGQSGPGDTQVQALLRLAALQGQLKIQDSGGRRLSGLGWSGWRGNGAACHRRRAASEGLHQRDHFITVDGLGQVGVHARRQAAIPIALHRVGRHGDDGHANNRDAGTVRSGVVGIGD